MTIQTPTITLRQVLDLAHQLPCQQRAELIAQLARDLVAEEATPTPPTNDAWARMARLREELAALPANRLASEQLDADRAERQAMLEGEHVHH
jgi:hypothetical protein